MRTQVASGLGCTNFHRLLRNALKIKVLDVQPREPGSVSRRYLGRVLSTQQELYDRTWSSAYSIEHLWKIATPPGGRLSHLVWEVLEERFELSAGDRQLCIRNGR